MQDTQSHKGMELVVQRHLSLSASWCPYPRGLEPDLSCSPRPTLRGTREFLRARHSPAVGPCLTKHKGLGPRSICSKGVWI